MTRPEAWDTTFDMNEHEPPALVEPRAARPYETPARKVLGDYLRWTKARWGLGSAWMARQLSVSRATILAWRSGASLPTVQNAFSLEALTGIKARWWLADHDLVVLARAEAEAYRLQRLPPKMKEAGPHNDWALPGQIPLFGDTPRATIEPPAALVAPSPDGDRPNATA